MAEKEERNGTAAGWVILTIIILIAVAIGFLIGKSQAEVIERVETVEVPQVQTVTVTKTVEVPIKVESELPVYDETPYIEIPLSHALQRYICEICAEEEVPVALIYALIEEESKFNPEIVSATDDYGLMQINKINFGWLEEKYRATDMLNPYQNVFCGIKIIGSQLKRYDNDIVRALMAYGMGDYGAKKAWESGITSTWHTEQTQALMEKYEVMLNE